MSACPFQDVTVWGGIEDATRPGDVLAEGNRIKAVAWGAGGSGGSSPWR